VVIVEDHDLVRLGLRAVLEAYRVLEVVAEVSTVAGAVAAAVEWKPSLVVAAETLADGTGRDVCREVRARVPAAGVVILGNGHVDADTERAAREDGALDHLSRRAGARSLCRALYCLAVSGGRPPESPPLLRERGRPRAGPGLLALTAQEHRVLQLVARGRTNREIGDALGLSEKTVKNYLSHAFEKLSVSRRAQAAVLFAREYGLRLDPASLGRPIGWTNGST
jgi:two-component system response regulator DevR